MQIIIINISNLTTATRTKCVSMFVKTVRKYILGQSSFWYHSTRNEHLTARQSDYTPEKGMKEATIDGAPRIGVAELVFRCRRVRANYGDWTQPSVISAKPSECVCTHSRIHKHPLPRGGAVGICTAHRLMRTVYTVFALSIESGVGLRRNTHTLKCA